MSIYFVKNSTKISNNDNTYFKINIFLSENIDTNYFLDTMGVWQNKIMS